MGFSIGGGLGPFRASISPRGLRGGISTGVGPVRYNKTLVSTRRGGYQGTTYSIYQQPTPLPRRPDYSQLLPSTNQLAPTTGSHAAAKLSGHDELTDLLNDAASYRSGALLVSLPTYALALSVLVATSLTWLALLLFLTGIALAIVMRRRARPFRSVNVSYALPTDGFATPAQLQAVQRHTELTRLWPQLLRAQRIWRRTRSGHVRNPYEQKINSGANLMSLRADVHAGYARPPHLTLDAQISIPSLRSENHHLFFLPDRVLVYDSSLKTYASTDYQQLKISVGACDYVEDVSTSSLPRDARRSGTTWLRVNKNGTPDRRYAHNYRIPVMRYDTLDLISTPTGLRWELIISRPGTAQTIASALIE